MDTQRIILLMILSFSLVMLWDAWQRQGQPKPQASPAAAKSEQAVTPAPTLPPVAPVVSVPAPGGTASQAPKALVKTDLLIAEVSAQGGDLSRLELLQHKGTEDKSKNFVLFDSGERHVYLAQSGLIGEGLPNHKTEYKLVPGTNALKEGEDKLELRLEAAGPKGVKTSKVYTFHRGSYVIDVRHEIENTGPSDLSTYAYFQLARDNKPPEGDSRMVPTFTGPAVYTEEAKFQKLDFADLEKGKAKFVQKASNGWVAMIQHYFFSAWLPEGKIEREYYARKVGEGVYAAGLIVPLSPIAAGQTGRISVPLYAGPQEQAKLERLSPGLDLVVDYGWLTVIAAPLFWVLQWLHSLVGNWGWAIILLTVLIKLLFFPLSAASYKSMAKMRVVTPRLMQLKERYGNDRARMNQEMMELYKKEKINPLGGCLPIVVQIPVFIALYWVLLASVEMRHAPWIGWIKDLSAMDPYFILPLIMGGTMLIQTKLNPTPPDPIQAKVMMFMPIAFTAMFLFFPAGLVLYWTVNNVLSIAQQWQITRMIEGGKAKAG
jgi:YidC/Oxa1 family membrane protein insertase